MFMVETNSFIFEEMADGFGDAWQRGAFVIVYINGPTDWKSWPDKF